jgi:PHS family inorganic phosphate transporter-like MFS transporter
MGKIGSIIAQAAIAPLRTRGATKANASPWQNHVMQIYSLFMFLGIFTTLCIPETKRLTLEQLSGEEPMGHGTESRDVGVLGGKESPAGTEHGAEESKQAPVNAI